eukprot:jgi/Botrbrau1/15838/Bobra.40_1s0022.1
MDRVPLVGRLVVTMRERRPAGGIVLFTCAIFLSFGVICPAGRSDIPTFWRYGLPSLIQSRIPEIWIPEADPEAHLGRQTERLDRTHDSIYAIGPEGFQPINVLREGVWEVVGEGQGRMCLLLLRFPAYLRHLLSFKLHLGRGGEMVVYEPGQSLGRTHCWYNCRLVTSWDVPSSRLTIPRIDGDAIMIEYWQPLEENDEQAEVWEAGEEDEEPFIVLEAAMQGLGGVGLREAVERRVLWQAGTGFDMLATQVTGSTISSCTQVVACNTTWNETQARGIVAIYVVDPLQLTVNLCSGSIVNSPADNHIFLMTADHCFVNKSQVNDFENWVLAFNYKTDACSPNAPIPPMVDVVQGVGLRSYDTRMDILVLQVMGTLADKFRVYALGYDGRPDYVPKNVIGLHHPNGDVMHISYALGPGAVSTNFTAWAFPASELQPTDATHFEVKWTNGVTAPGSSGSPLIDADTGLILGILTGGPSACRLIGTSKGKDYYGRLSVAFRFGLDRFLSNVPSGDFTASDAIQLHFLAQGALVVNQQQGRDVLNHGPGFNSFPSHLSLSLTRRQGSVTYYLTDSPEHDEVISADLVFKGNIPGNQQLADSYVDWNPGPINFTHAAFHKYPRSLTVRLKDNVTAIPGDIMRFMIVVQLSSNTNSSYRSINVISGTIQTSILPWWQFPIRSLDCESLPCIYNFTQNRELNLTGDERAVFASNMTGLILSSRKLGTLLKLYIKPDAFPTTMLSAYCDGIIVWCQTPATTLGNAESVYVLEDNNPTTASSCVIVLSDFQDLDAALPLSLVVGISFVETGPVQLLLPGQVAVQGTDVTNKATTESFVIPLAWRNRTNVTATPGTPLGMPGALVPGHSP